MTPDDRKRYIESVRYYISQGWRVMPLCYPVDGKCTCGRQAAFDVGKHKTECSPGKAPHFKLAPVGSKNATTDIEVIKKWFAQDIAFNIGICAGKDSNLVILDVDPGHGGAESLKKFPLGKTATVLTGSGGNHYYFTHPGGDIKNSAGTIGDGLDVRGHNGYVVAPPSLHPCGKEYVWAVDAKAITTCPSWVISKKRSSKSPVGDNIKSGERNDKLMSIAGKLRRDGLAPDELYAALLAVNTSRCDEPLDDGEVLQIAESAGSYKPDETHKNKIVLKDDLPTTIAVAFEKASLVSHHYNSVDQWSIYSDNKYQQIVDDKELETYIIRFISKCSVKKQRKEGKDWVETKEPLKKQSRSFIRDVMLALRSMRAVHILPSKKAPSSFSSAINPKKTIAVANGLLDLTDMSNPKMNPFTPDFYTFNYLPVDYDPDAISPRWTNEGLGFYFTEDDVNIPDTVAQDVIHSWYKRWLCRIMTPHKICALIGQKRSGKSTIGRIACALIGQSNVSAMTITSLSGPHGMHGLMNKQLGIMWDVSVTGKNTDINKAVEALKNISGQDNIQVNPKRRDTIELAAMPLNILMIANKTADLKDNTGALASRFTFLNTTQSFYGREDPSLEKHIIGHELSGILNLVLAAPNEIVEHPSSGIYAQEFAEMSSAYTAFANDCCKIGDPEDIIPVDILWAYYCDWCEKYRQKIPAARTFKVEFISAIQGIKRARPRLDCNEIDGLRREHEVDQRSGPKLYIPERPYCFTGIDVIEDMKGQWNQSENSSWSGPGPGF